MHPEFARTGPIQEIPWKFEDIRDDKTGVDAESWRRIELNIVGRLVVPWGRPSLAFSCLRVVT
jgi:hypothetical protein